LDALYATALGAAGKWDSDKFSEDFRLVLGMVLTSRMPLSDNIIDRLLNLDEDRSSHFILARMHCLLVWSPGEPVRTLHASFSDYLTDPLRCGTNPWSINLPLANRDVALACLQVMKIGLQFNICGLETSYCSNQDVPGLARRIKSAIPDHVAYACRSWANHLQEAPGNKDLQQFVKDFVHSQLLYWLEVWSLIGRVELGSPAMLKTIGWSRVS
jgi:hypothetical protein